MIVKRLEPAAEYDFRVLAISRSGRGITSPALNIATIAERWQYSQFISFFQNFYVFYQYFTYFIIVFIQFSEEVPGIVQQVSVNVLSSTSVRVNWARPADDDTFVKFYKLFYECTDDAQLDRSAEIEIQVRENVFLNKSLVAKCNFIFSIYF